MADQKPKLVVIEKNCRYCQACMLACSMIHEQGNSSLEKARLSIKREISDNKVTISAGGGFEFTGDLAVTGKITATQNIESDTNVVAGVKVVTPTVGSP